MSEKRSRPVTSGAASETKFERAATTTSVAMIAQATGEQLADTYQLLPPLTDDEYAALREDISINGVRVPVDIDEDGQILDGHHRATICAELGIDCRTRVVAGLTDEEKRHHALAVNLQRRTLTGAQRRTMIVGELRRDSTRSDRAMGRLLGVDGKTVGAVRHELDAVKRAREEELARERRDREALTMDALRVSVTGASTRQEKRVWAAWVSVHHPHLTDQIARGHISLLDGVLQVAKHAGCGLDCEHSSAINDLLPDVIAAEIPHYTPPLRSLGPFAVHPVDDLFPIPQDTLREMATSIKRRGGLLHAIVLTHDQTTIVDGRLRYLACQIAGVEPTYTTLPSDYTDEQIYTYILVVNLMRMSYREDQLAAIDVLASDGAR